MRQFVREGLHSDCFSFPSLGFNNSNVYTSLPIAVLYDFIYKVCIYELQPVQNFELYGSVECLRIQVYISTSH